MAIQLNRLSPRHVQGVTKPGLHADGGGLYLRVSPSGAKAWTFIYHFPKGRRREMGFGSLAAVGLAAARKKAQRAREVIDDGNDPQIALKLGGENADGATFGQAADSLVDFLEMGWRNPKHRQQWRNTLRDHCKPIWGKPVNSIGTEDVVAVLSGIWNKTPETASRLRGRIERVLDAAKVAGQRDGENPARWRGHLEIILPKRKKKSQVRHHPAMPYADVPAFLQSLKLRLSIAARALEFLILNTSRTAEVIFAKWKEIHREAREWRIPGERMKMELDHVVPLTDQAFVILDAMAVFGMDPDGYIFPGRVAGKPLSNMAMQMLLRRMDHDEFTVHGFRSSFRDWAGDETDHPREIVEMQLAHAVGDETERAYRRAKALRKRRQLLEDWHAYVYA